MAGFPRARHGSWSRSGLLGNVSVEIRVRTLARGNDFRFRCNQTPRDRALGVVRGNSSGTIFLAFQTTDPTAEPASLRALISRHSLNFEVIVWVQEAAVQAINEAEINAILQVKEVGCENPRVKSAPATLPLRCACWPCHEFVPLRVHFYRPFGVRRPRGFFLPMLNGGGAGYKRRRCIGVGA